MTPKPLILALETSSRIGSVALALGQNILAEAAFSAPLRHSAEIFPAIHRLLGRFSQKPSQIEHIYISIGPGSFTGLRIATTIAKTMHLANAAKIVAVDTLDVIAANVINLTNTSHGARGTGHVIRDSSHEPRITNHETIATILDAKRSQFFIAAYQRHHPESKLSSLRKKESISTNAIPVTQYAIRDTSDGIWEKILPDSLLSASQFLDKFACREKPIWLLGDGLLYHKDKFKPVPSGVEGADGIRFFDEKYWSPKASNVHLLGWKKTLANQFADPLTLNPTYLRKPDVKIKPR